MPLRPAVVDLLPPALLRRPPDAERVPAPPRLPEVFAPDLLLREAEPLFLPAAFFAAEDLLLEDLLPPFLAALFRLPPFLEADLAPPRLDDFLEADLERELPPRLDDFLAPLFLEAPFLEADLEEPPRLDDLREALFDDLPPELFLPADFLEADFFAFAMLIDF